MAASEQDEVGDTLCARILTFHSTIGEHRPKGTVDLDCIDGRSDAGTAGRLRLTLRLTNGYPSMLIVSPGGAETEWHKWRLVRVSAFSQSGHPIDYVKTPDSVTNGPNIPLARKNPPKDSEALYHLAGPNYRLSCFTAILVRAEPVTLGEVPGIKHNLTTDNDVVFVFPFEAVGQPTCLWANTARLVTASDYFKAMLCDGMAESDNVLGATSDILESYEKEITQVINKERKTRSAVQVDDQDFTLGSPRPDNEVLSHNGKVNLRYVVIRNTPYKLYEAVFTWLFYQTIQFGPVGPAAPDRRCSPKEIYLLCHELGLKKLADWALRDYQSKLNTSNVIAEAFSDETFVYPELKQTALDYIKDNWSEVKAGKGLDEVCAGIFNRENSAPAIATMAFDLLRRL